jgi:hypothetical protein
VTTNIVVKKKESSPEVEYLSNMINLNSSEETKNSTPLRVVQAPQANPAMKSGPVKSNFLAKISNAP